MHQKDYKRAVNDLEILYANTIPDNSILNSLGYSYSKIGETKLAKKFLLAAINIDPGYSYPYNNLGYVYMLEGNLSKAHELIDKSIELDPTNSYAFKNRALAYLKGNDTANAIAALEKAKALRFDLYYGDEVNNMLNELIGEKN
jgi:Flp pilus assembly protein TadD